MGQTISNKMEPGNNSVSSLPKGKLSKILLKAIETTGEMVVVTTAPEKIGNEEIVFVNKAFENVTQYSREEVMGKSPSFLQGPDTNEAVIKDLVEQLEKGNRFEGETFNYKKDGSRYRVRWSIDAIHNAQGNITHYVSVQKDVTEEWKRKKQLDETAKKLETLVKETHHRVKNNLSTVSGLLELQAMESSSDEVKEVLKECVRRVRAIASIHRKLYKTNNLSTIEIHPYFEDLVTHIKNSVVDAPGQEVEIKLDIEPIELDTTKALPMGLILNELITNSMKYAFKDDSGAIYISLKRKNGKVIMKYKDNGIGLPEDIDPDNTDSLGIKLIETLSMQLEGEFNFKSNDGLRFSLTFQRE